MSLIVYNLGAKAELLSTSPEHGIAGTPDKLPKASR